MTSRILELLVGAPRRKSQAKPCRPRSFRPRLDYLEDRIALNAYHVINLSDINSGFGSWGSLRYCITQANANPYSTIDFTPGMMGTISLKSALNITQAVEIDGPGTAVITLSGRNLNQVFRISTTNAVTITDLTISNGRNAYGPGGAVYNTAPLTLARVTFANSQSLDGGAFYNYGNSATTTINDCLFTNNHVANPPGYFSTVFGGAITSYLATLTVINTQFTNNYALGASNQTGSPYAGVAQGGAVNCFEDLGTDTFSNCTFTGNSARGGTNCTGIGGANYIGIGQGGAIDVEDSWAEVDQCTFSQNYAQGGQGSDAVAGSYGRIGIGLGGAIEVGYGGQLTVDDSTFSGNRALGANYGHVQAGTDSNQGVGGAINDEGAVNFLSVAGCTFSGNRAKGGVSGILDSTSAGYLGSFGVGGAINLGLSASGDISGSTFSNNSAIGASGTGDAAGGYALGGAIDTFPTSLTISDSQFTNNRAQGGNGGPSGALGADAEGGGLYANGGTLNLWDLTFTSNRAIGGTGLGSGHSGGLGLGGGMSLYATATTADNLDLQSNLAQGGVGWGGANGGGAFGGGIYTQNDYLVMLSDSTITLNTAQGGLGSTSGGGYGGGIASFEYAGVLQLFNTNVYSNHASTFGDDFYP